MVKFFFSSGKFVTGAIWRNSILIDIRVSSTTCFEVGFRTLQICDKIDTATWFYNLCVKFYWSFEGCFSARFVNWHIFKVILKVLLLALSLNSSGLVSHRFQTLPLILSFSYYLWL